MLKIGHLKKNRSFFMNIEKIELECGNIEQKNEICIIMYNIFVCQPNLSHKCWAY